MKKLFFASLMLLVCTAASAQFAKSKSSASAASAAGASSVYFQYNPQSLNYDDGSDSDSESGFTGLLVGYKMSTAVSTSTPLFLEYGGAFQYTMYSKHKQKTNIATVMVPVNLTYGFQLPGSAITISPYVGATAKFHLLGTSKYDDSDYSGSAANLFDSDDVGEAANRFQIGYQLGVNVKFDKFYVGLGYGADITEFMEDTKFSTTSITVGFNL